MDEHVKVVNPRTGVWLEGERAPKRSELGAWLLEHPGWRPFVNHVGPAASTITWARYVCGPGRAHSKWVRR